MGNRADNYDEKFDFWNNHYLMVVPAGGLRSGYDVLNDWNLDRKGNYESHEEAVEAAREKARYSPFDGVVAFHPPAEKDEEQA